MVAKRPQVTIYTDGSADPNPGPGGYGVVLLSGERRKELSGGFRATTNNRMEIMAAICGLEALKNPSDVTLYSDSRYVVDSISKGWAEKWRANGWMRTKKEPAVNPDLWERLLVARERHNVDFRWVRGHAGNPGNERADRLATEAGKLRNLRIDEGYESAEAGSSPQQMLRASGGSLTKMTEPGQPCANCGTPVERRVPKRKKLKPNQHYYFEWYLYCPGCKKQYMVESAKRFVEQAPLQ